MYQRHRRIACPQLACGSVVLVVSLAYLGACTPSPAVSLTHPVRGHVLVDDRPAAGALVVLSPLKGSVGDSRPRGYVDQDGGFRLTTHSLDDGAPAGSYAVAVIWQEQADEDDAPGLYLAHKKYSDPATSGIQVDIRAGANELEPFELTK